jgi:quinoprotein glucose dehydrogenase
MTFKSAMMAVGTVWIAGMVLQPAVTAQEKTVWDGVYTEAQAKRGQAAYEADCASCHQADFAGDGFAPGLAGPEFAAAWNGLPISDLYERIRQSMPPSNPDSVPPATKVDIVAYLLKGNRMPAGTTELPKEPAAMKEIQYKATKP